ncbi:hypothetical protein A8B79_09980 [Balneola sp. EhC07]|uniref:hypothetical protein n=1 Tax=Balneola sp. EhC07 TaxID=1849360 RepID=UPI0007F39B85|nr:hypothetical protein [Balneola sp. EhC07]OAN60832.1 hypothetical protein A8B79_09980 [Balneola sp. EhC07]
MAKKEEKNKEDCFVIMPISDVEGYESGHFSRVYRDLIIPAIESSNYNPIRSDEVKQTNLIHLDILQKLIDAPMAVCDLSTRNPNVLFELGIRQAFDKPVVLIQEEGTPKIFDIDGLRTLRYSKHMRYHEVLNSQSELSESITATKKAINEKGNINSIIRLLGLNAPAKVPLIEDGNKNSLEIKVIQNQLSDLKKMLEINYLTEEEGRKNDYIVLEHRRILRQFEKLKKLSIDFPKEAIQDEFSEIMSDLMKLVDQCDDNLNREIIFRLIKKVDDFYYDYLNNYSGKAKN